MYDEEQCPKRTAGLTHVTLDGYECVECGALRPPGLTLMDWIRAMRGQPITPRVVKVSGEPETKAEPEPKLGDFAALTEREWHAVLIERSHHESHDCDDAHL
jgi:hypothetical protein